jgi:hypothetical protein
MPTFLRVICWFALFIALGTAIQAIPRDELLLRFFVAGCILVWSFCSLAFFVRAMWRFAMR